MTTRFFVPIRVIDEPGFGLDETFAHPLRIVSSLSRADREAASRILVVDLDELPEYGADEDQLAQYHERQALRHWEAFVRLTGREPREEPPIKARDWKRLALRYEQMLRDFRVPAWDERITWIERQREICDLADSERRQSRGDRF